MLRNYRMYQLNKHNYRKRPISSGEGIRHASYLPNTLYRFLATISYMAFRTIAGITLNIIAMAHKPPISCKINMTANDFEYAFPFLKYMIESITNARSPNVSFAKLL